MSLKNFAFGQIKYYEDDKIRWQQILAKRNTVVRATQTKVQMTAGDMSFSECLGHLVWHGDVVPLHHAAVEW